MVGRGFYSRREGGSLINSRKVGRTEHSKSSGGSSSSGSSRSGRAVTVVVVVAVAVVIYRLVYSYGSLYSANTY